MAIFDIPLRAKFTLRLKEEAKLSGFTVTKKNGYWEATREVGLSIRAHNWVIQTLGLCWGENSYASLLEHSFDAYAQFSQRQITNLHGFLGNPNAVYCHGDDYNSEARDGVAPVYYAFDRAKVIDNIAIYSLVLPQEDEWKLREALKFVRGNPSYEAIPSEWNAFELFRGSVLDPTSADYVFPHISTAKDGMIAFTENAQKGQANIQKRMKPGKFIREFFGTKLNELYGENKANAIIADMAAKFGNAVKEEELQFAKTPEEIEWVYTHGPSSCMAHPIGNYDTSRLEIHPTRVLGAGDLQVAYLKRNGRVTARTLIWPEKKVMTRTYGDAIRIEPLLKRNGYKYGGTYCLDGAKLLKHQCDSRYRGGFVAPYIDGQAWARDEGDHLVIDNAKGFVYLANTCGSSEGGKECELCKKMWRKQEMRDFREAPSERTKIACIECWEDNTWTCHLTGGRYGNGYPKVALAGGKLFASEKGFRDYGFTCAYDKQNYAIDGTYQPKGTPLHSPWRCNYVNMWDGSRWHRRNFEAHGKTYEGRLYSKKAYERQILKDMGQSDLPLAEAAYAKVLEERRLKAEEERRLFLENIQREREEAKKKERERINKRRRDIRAIRKELARRDITLSGTARAATPLFRFIPKLNEYWYVSPNFDNLTEADFETMKGGQ